MNEKEIRNKTITEVVDLVNKIANDIYMASEDTKDSYERGIASGALRVANKLLIIYPELIK